MGLRASRNIGRMLRRTEAEGEEVKNGTNGSISLAQLPVLESSPVPLSFDSRFRAEFNIMANIIGRIRTMQTI